MRILEEYGEFAEQEKYVEAIVSLIHTRRTVSFIEIEKLLSQYMDTEGSIALYHSSYPNILFWANMSQQFFDIMVEVFKTKKVVPTPSNILVYAMDGKILKFPIAKRAMQYKKEHWLPVVFNPSH